MLSNCNTITGSSELYYVEEVLYVNCSSDVCQFPRLFGYLSIKECSTDSGAASMGQAFHCAELHVRPSDGFKEDSNTIISEQEPIFGSNKIWLNKHAEITMLHHVLQNLEP